MTAQLQLGPTVLHIRTHHVRGLVGHILQDWLLHMKYLWSLQGLLYMLNLQHVESI